MKKVMIGIVLLWAGSASAEVLRIDEATLSAGDFQCDATTSLRGLCNGRTACDVPVDSRLCAYKHGGSPMLEVRYHCGQDRYRVEAPWGQRVGLYCEQSDYPESAPSSADAYALPPPPTAPPPVTLEIRQARYGMPGHGWCDATWAVGSQCNRETECRLRPSNSLCGDPVPGEIKQLQVRYRCGWNEREVIIAEKQYDTLACEQPVAGQFQNPNGIQVVQAEYGAGHHRCNARPALAQRCDGGYSCNFKVDNRLCGDPARHQVKDLTIRWRCGWEEMSAQFAENQWAEISCMQRRPRNERPTLPPPAHRQPVLHILSANYGQFPGRVCDASSKVAQRCEGQGSCNIKASNSLCGDPARRVKKMLRIQYACAGKKRMAEVHEGERIQLRCP